LANYQIVIMKDIVGRSHQRQRLDELKQSKKSEFAVVYGRRRVGKTFLVREHFDYQFDFHLMGLANASTEQQLFNFDQTLRRYPYIDDIEKSINWLQAFDRLRSYIETIDRPDKKVIFIDEMPWLDTARSDFMMGLEHFWNGWATTRKDILLISCGSAASWMINELINNHGGLHNRVTAQLKLDPFTLKETELLLIKNECVYERYQIVQLYMALGGIPYYLDAVDSSLSAMQNIQNLFFSKSAILAMEYDKLFASLFKKSERHTSVIEALSTKKKGLTRKEIISKTKLPSGGSFTNLLSELEESGFISSYVPLDKKVKSTLYRLSDFFCLFYLQFVKENKQTGEGTWINMIDNPSYRAWSGYAYEQICLHHLPQIKNALGIAGVQSLTSSWIGEIDKDRVQIDMVIDRRDQVINLMEVKFSEGQYRITKSYAEELRKKVSTFKTVTKTKKAVFLSMITTHGLVQNQYSGSLVQNDLSMDVLFE